eukprot:5173298-Amphidinium_carterae.1
MQPQAADIGNGCVPNNKPTTLAPQPHATNDSPAQNKLDSLRFAAMVAIDANHIFTGCLHTSS